jgi:hypothetical protein
MQLGIVICKHVKQAVIAAGDGAIAAIAAEKMAARKEQGESRLGKIAKCRRQ